MRRRFGNKLVLLLLIGGLLTLPSQAPSEAGGSMVGQAGRPPLLSLSPQGDLAETERDESANQLTEIFTTQVYTWAVDTVDAPGDVGSYASLALDGADTPHISYYDASNQQLKYACLSGTVWLIDVVPGSVAMGQYTSLALDSDGHPHISCYNETHGDLLYVYHDGANWQIETVDSTGDVGQYTSLALDGLDCPHIGYYGVTKGDLRYAYHDGSAWITETVDSRDNVGLYASFTLDPSGLAHVSYYDQDDGDLLYAFDSGTAWITETVDSSGDVGQYSSLALEGSGWAHISYYDHVNSDLRYARYSETAWITETVDAGGDVGLYTSLALDASGLPRISYHDSGNTELKFAQLSGTIWLHDVVDDVSHVGAYTSLALDSYGRPHIAYYSISNANLKYAFGVPPCDPVETVEITGTTLLLIDQVGTYTATVLPPTATLPVTLTWSNDTVSSTAFYSWTDPGVHTVTVSATNRCSTVTGKLTVTVCQPVTDVVTNGPASLPMGVNGTYTATVLPPTATLPVTRTWSNGTVGPSAVYSWTVTGTQTVAVTVANRCGNASGSMVVSVTACQPVTDVVVNGPPVLPVGGNGTYMATALPLTATQPVTWTWSNGTVGCSAVYSWTITGTQIVAVTATNSCGEACGSMVVTVTVCQPMEAVAVDGPALLPVGAQSTYTATHSPPTATWPVTFRWDDGTMSSTAVYSWTGPGVHTVTVSATNLCSRVTGTLTVTVCQAVTGVEVNGPASLAADQVGAYTATYLPLTATLPVTFSWGDGTVGPSAVFSWAVGGTYIVAVTATNGCGQVSGSKPVLVLGPGYLPLVSKGWNKCFLDPHGYFEVEPNDWWDNANGPLCENQAYQGRPDDENDFYFFDNTTGMVTVTMWNYRPISGWLILSDEDRNDCGIDSTGADGWQVVAPCAAGKNYIRVATPGNLTTTISYTLQVELGEP